MQDGKNFMPVNENCLLINKTLMSPDNPYDVADKWLLKENLPLSFREQVVQFILQNTGQNNVTFDASFRDPYTGSHAYVPGQPSHLSGNKNSALCCHSCVSSCSSCSYLIFV
ncbi:hypothetical protein VIGAN_09083100 [Vigna angularis var. angularis]|uniref:PFU domain-containing protein n=1 Tax=Vigna angularis var. angularis TaxID=157739 RepID=A0A0S3SX41_PHAAN|nr:hypothetical protein VIGAN_09083100 [Vigna angularis var. angularis]